MLSRRQSSASRRSQSRRNAVTNGSSESFEDLSSYVFGRLLAGSVSHIDARLEKDIKQVIATIIAKNDSDNAYQFIVHANLLPSRYRLALLVNFPELRKQLQKEAETTHFTAVVLECIDVAERLISAIDVVLSDNDEAQAEKLLKTNELCEQSQLKLLIHFPALAKKLFVDKSTDAQLRQSCEYALIKDAYDKLWIEQVITANDAKMAETAIKNPTLKHEYRVKLLDKFLSVTAKLQHDETSSQALKTLCGSRSSRSSFSSIRRIIPSFDRVPRLSAATIDYTVSKLLEAADDNNLLVQVAVSLKSWRLADYLLKERQYALSPQQAIELREKIARPQDADKASVIKLPCSAEAAEQSNIIFEPRGVDINA